MSEQIVIRATVIAVRVKALDFKEKIFAMMREWAPYFRALEKARYNNFL